MTAPTPRPRAWRRAWLGGALCALLWVSSPTTASADEPVALSVLNQGPTQRDGRPPSLLAGAVLSISGALVSGAGLIAMYGEGLCTLDCEDEEDPHAAAIAFAVMGGVMALVGLLVVLPIQAYARRRWLRERGLRFSGRPGGGTLGFEGRF